MFVEEYKGGDKWRLVYAASIAILSQVQNYYYDGVSVVYIYSEWCIVNRCTLDYLAPIGASVTVQAIGLSFIPM